MYVNAPVVLLYVSDGLKLAPAVDTVIAPKFVAPPVVVPLVVVVVPAKLVVVLGAVCTICPDTLSPASPGCVG